MLSFFIVTLPLGAEEEKYAIINKRYPHPLMVMLDFNEDEVLTFMEFENAPKFKGLSAERRESIFLRFDKNKDSKVTNDELPPYEREIPYQIKPWNLNNIGNLDADKDGYVSFEELQQGPFIRDFEEARQKGIFDYHDQNKDGKLSATDYLLEVKYYFVQQRDVNQDKKVDISELKLSPFFSEMEDQELKFQFDRRDTDQDGGITNNDVWPLDLISGCNLKP